MKPKIFFSLVDASLEGKARLPQYMSDGASGADIFACLSEPMLIQPLARVMIPTGLKIAIEEGYEGQIRARSGTAFKKGLMPVNTPGTIDSDYRGELKIILINLNTEPVTIEPGERIAQLIIAPAVRAEMQLVSDLPPTSRGEGGFGSTGHK